MSTVESKSRTRRLATGAVLAGGVLGGVWLGAAPSAFAYEDPAANPPNCSAADLEGVRSGVQFATSAYLFTHPDVNAYVTTLDGLSRDEVAAQMQTYFADHPQVQAEMNGIRAPLVDMTIRCATTPAGP